MSVTPVAPLVRSGSCPVALIAAVRRAVGRGTDWQHMANLVAGTLHDNLPGTDLLTDGQLRGDPAGYQTHLVHAEPDGSFSIAMMVWLPGQQTPVHDHVTWCVTAVLQGTEYEEIFAWRDGSLEVAERRQNAPGTVSGFAPPGDIHRVCNAGSGVAVSMHVYGADLTRLGSSVRREYAVPAA
jgi:predicted metal-dependent enzyme (double-stranded beta helix superfamily)